MSKETVRHGQCFFDKVIETTGSIENTFEMALLNKITITDDLTIGTDLKLTKVTDRFVANFFNETNRPASALPKIVSNKINYAFPTQY